MIWTETPQESSREKAAHGKFGYAVPVLPTSTTPKPSMTGRLRASGAMPLVCKWTNDDMTTCPKCGCEISCMGQTCPGCMTRVTCEWCGGKGTLDSGGVTPWGAEIQLPCPHCTAKWDDLVAIGAAWKADSSLEKWFPITAEEVTSLRAQVAALTVGSEDRRPNLPPAKCVECGGDHEPSGARSDCIRHWKFRAIVAENKLLVNKIYGTKET